MSRMTVDGTTAPKQGAGNDTDASFGNEYDEIATLASALCRSAQSMVMLLHEQHGWIRLSGTRRLRDIAIGASFCEQALARAHPLVIEDAEADPTFVDDPQVLREPHLRFFAGVPFHDADGRPIGVLCVTDPAPRVLTSEQEEALTLLARQLSARIELRAKQRQLDQVQQERESSAANLRASEELFRTFMNASPFLSYLKDAAGRLLFYNRSYARRFGINEYAWLGRTDEQLWSRSVGPSSRLHDLEVMEGGRTVEAEERLRGSNGLVTVWRTYKFPCHDSSGNLMLAGLAMDVTEEREQKGELERFQEELQEVNEQLRRLSVTDELTGLRNRRAFEERLALEFSISRRRHRDLAVLLIDVDNFKGINDRWGHGAGDAVLRRLSALLRTTVRLPDLVARYGGEEFVVLLPETGAQAALGFCRRLMERMAAETWDHEPVTVSIGLAALQDTLLNGFQLVTMADEALYAAKRAGKNRVVVHGGARS